MLFATRPAPQAKSSPAQAKTHANAAIPGAEDYYNLPVLKPPTWTWEVPLYFFVGGIAGMSSLIAFVGHLFHADPRMIRVVLWIPLIGAGLCPALLISDLGRPLRFLNMLRVFKWRSAMSMGSWILSAFGGAAFLALAMNELILYGIHMPFLPPLQWLAEFAAAVTGLLLASYTGVLIGATAIPVWHENRLLLPGHFLTSGLGGFGGNSGALRVSRPRHADPGIRHHRHRNPYRLHSRIAPWPRARSAP